MHHKIESHLDTTGRNDTLAYENEDIVAYVSIAGFLAMTVILLVFLTL